MEWLIITAICLTLVSVVAVPAVVFCRHVDACGE